MDIKALNTTFLDIDSIECNEGQIEGVPSNPRTISEERMEALKKSVEELPDMLSMRELLVYPNGGVDLSLSEVIRDCWYAENLAIRRCL